MKRPLWIWNLRQFLHNASDLQKLVQSSTQMTKPLLSPQLSPQPGLGAHSSGGTGRAEANPWTVSLWAVASPAAPWQGQVKAVRSEVHTILHCAALQKLESRRGNGRADTASAGDVKSLRFGCAASLSVGPWDHGASSLGHQTHLLQHVPPRLQFSFLFLPSSPSKWAHLKIQESLSTWNRNLLFRNVVLGTFWIETGKNPKLHASLCGLYLCFLWNELRHSNSFQIAAKAKRPHCP